MPASAGRAVLAGNAGRFVFAELAWIVRDAERARRRMRVQPVRILRGVSRLVRGAVAQIAEFALDRGHQVVDAHHQRAHLTQRFVLMQHGAP